MFSRRIMENVAALAAVPLFAPLERIGHRRKAGMFAASSVSDADYTFACTAARSGLSEVALGRLAGRRALDEEVRSYGDHMVREHSPVNTRLMGLGLAKRMVLPVRPDDEQDAFRRRLDALEGAEFDRLYVARMVSDHEAAVEHFRHQRDHGEDRDLAAFAERNLPMLERHLDMARALAQRLGE